MTDTDMLYMASLEKRNAELEARVAELEEKHWNECGQIAHYDDELRTLLSKVDIGAAQPKDYLDLLNELCEAKRLLKAAVEDMYNSVNDVHCKYCSKWHTDQCQETSHLDCYIENKFKWRHEAEALALIGEDGDINA